MERPMQCTAKSKQSGEQCKRASTTGRKVCSIHGGKSPSGLSSATLKHGRYSTSLPTRLASRYEQALLDPTLLDLDHEIALVDVRLDMLLARLETGESGEAWADVTASVAALLTARRTKDEGAMVAALNRIIETARSKHSDQAAWDDVTRMVDQRTRLVMAKHKRDLDLDQLLSIERFMLLAGAIVAIVNNAIDHNITDSDERRAARLETSAGIERLISRGDRGGIG
jgi:hypothetical protein